MPEIGAPTFATLGSVSAIKKLLRANWQADPTLSGTYSQMQLLPQAAFNQKTNVFVNATTTVRDTLRLDSIALAMQDACYRVELVIHGIMVHMQLILLSIVNGIKGFINLMISPPVKQTTVQAAPAASETSAAASGGHVVMVKGADGQILPAKAQAAQLVSVAPTNPVISVVSPRLMVARMTLPPPPVNSHACEIPTHEHRRAPEGYIPTEWCREMRPSIIHTTCACRSLIVPCTSFSCNPRFCHPPYAATQRSILLHVGTGTAGPGYAPHPALWHPRLCAAVRCAAPLAEAQVGAAAGGGPEAGHAQGQGTEP